MKWPKNWIYLKQFRYTKKLLPSQQFFCLIKFTSTGIKHNSTVRKFKNLITKWTLNFIYLTHQSWEIWKRSLLCNKCLDCTSSKVAFAMAVTPCCRLKRAFILSYSSLINFPPKNSFFWTRCNSQECPWVLQVDIMLTQNIPLVIAYFII